MTGKKTIHILTFVGLAGSGKTTAIERCAEHGIPHVSGNSADALSDEINHLAEVGQRILVTDSIDSSEQHRALKNLYPGQVTVIAIVSSRHHRHLRKKNLSASELDALDWEHVERGSLGAVIALADHSISNNASLEQYLADIDQLVDEISK